MKEFRDAPVGIFDSGIGGLTVARAIRSVLPLESLVYFGDTAHLPYGDKSEASIQAYSVKIADVLLRKGCKAIVIACNSASSAAYELLREYVRTEAKIINVIDPMIERVLHDCQGKKVGLIGTKRTIQSGVYTRKITESSHTIALKPLATPLLAPMIEEGFFNNRISHDIIESYLGDPILQGVDSLILACTHYPLIRKEIEKYYNRKVMILDSSDVVAESLKSYLTEKDLRSNTPPSDIFLVSDFTESFEQSTRLFFNSQVHLEKYPLWS
jgi:glutamate racemase